MRRQIASLATHTKCSALSLLNAFFRQPTTLHRNPPISPHSIFRPLGKIVPSVPISTHIAAFAAVCFLVATPFAFAGGKLVVANDEWTLSNTAFAALPQDTRAFALNLAQYFDEGGRKFHAFSTNFGLTQSELINTLTGAGYTYTTGTGITFDIDTLRSYDAIFLAGDLLSETQIATLKEYLVEGGNVYVAAGTSSYNPGLVAATWNSFLLDYGISYQSWNNGIGGNIPIVGTSHPIFDGVAYLYQNNGQSILGDHVEVYYNNQGMYAALGVSITTDSLPILILGNDYALPFTATAGVVPYVWSLVDGELPPGMELTEDGVIQGTPEELGVFPFTVRVEDLNGSSDEEAFALEVVLIPGAPDLRLEKVGTVPVPGQPSEYFILIENAGELASKETEIIEYLEPWLTLIATSEQPIEVLEGPDAFPPSSVGTDYPALLKWRVPGLAPGENHVLSYSAQLDDDLPAGVDVRGFVCVNPVIEGACASEYLDCLAEASIVCTNEPSDCVAGITACSLGTLSCHGYCAAALGTTQLSSDAVEKLVTGKRFVQPKRRLLYAIEFENIGGTTVDEASIVDVLDPGLDGSTLHVISADGASYDEVSRTLAWNLTNLELLPGETDHVMFSIKPQDDLPSSTELRNSAEILLGQTGPWVSNEVTSFIDGTIPRCALDALPETSTATGIQLSWNASDDVGEIDVSSVFVSQNGGIFEPVVEMTQDTTAVFAGEAGNTYGFLCVSRDTAGNVEDQDAEAETFTTILTGDSANLHVVKLDDPDPVAWGADLTYTIEVSNLGPSEAIAVRLEDTLLGGARIRSVRTTDGTCERERLSVECDLGNLAADEMATVTIIVRPQRPGVLKNTVEVSSQTPDSDLTDNAASVTTTVLRK